MENSRVLLVEDEPDLAREIVRGLARDRWLADHVTNLADAFEAIHQASYGLILLDRRLPDGDGLGLVAFAKSRASAPVVIFLTARDEVEARVAGLDAGGDDYLVKPFAMDELLARMRAALRKANPAGPPKPLTAGALAFDPETREVRIAGRPHRLPRRELLLLEVMIRRAGRVVPREYLEAQLYGLELAVTPNALETHASRLRRRLDAAGAGLQLRTVRGIGYILLPC